MATADRASDYPTTSLGRKLSAVSLLIDSGLDTRVYYVTHNGFDTHSKQARGSRELARELGDAMSAFTNDMKLRGHDERVAVMAFSEFGRRVRENASRGTVMVGAPVFVAGGNVKPGPMNEHLV
ncbi:MAG: DUF1501 domain-containing protein [Pirellulaceae bacterium]